MNTYITGAEIKRLRENKGLTQAALAEKLCVSDKAVSKWETGHGYPDIAMLEPLSSVLGVSVIELMAGASVTNRNKSANLKRSVLYVCPVCGNVVFSTGEAVISCCGLTLPPLETEVCDEEHTPVIEEIDGELYVTLNHEMTKSHNISFIALATDDTFRLVKKYPEMDCSARFPMTRTGKLFIFCNHHGLFKYELRSFSL